jgi:serine/threonine protein kinase
LPIAFDSARSRPGGRSLAEILTAGPLPLETALRHATEIALALREMHQDGRAHGSVEPQNIFIKSGGALLVTPERRGYTDPLDDLAGFGIVLYAMLTGKPPGDEFRLVPGKPPVVKGPAAVRAAATRLAERCLTAERETAPDLQKILTEVRLLHVMSKQFQPDTPNLFAVPPPPPPPSFPPPQPLDVFAGKAAPIINPPVVNPPVVPAIGPPRTAPPPPLQKPGENSPATVRARGSHSRPVLKDVMCPKCKGYHVRLSRPRTHFERFLNLLGIGIHRCHRCFYRYIPILGRKIVHKPK